MVEELLDDNLKTGALPLTSKLWFIFLVAILNIYTLLTKSSISSFSSIINEVISEFFLATLFPIFVLFPSILKSLWWGYPMIGANPEN